MKKFIGSILSVMLICLLTLNVSAAEIVEENIVDGSVLNSDEQSETIYSNLIKGNILNRAAAKITNNGNGSVNIYGAAYGSTTCDKIVLEMTLQKLVNGSWQNVKSFSGTASGKSYLIKSYNVSVTKGYYYRLKTACVATKNGVSESQAPVTDGILIN